MLFSSIAHDVSQLLQGIKSKIEDVPICGCSCFGNITHLGNDESSHSVALMGLQSDVINFYPFIFDGLKENSQQVGKEIGSKLNHLGLSESSQKLLISIFLKFATKTCKHESIDG